MGGGGALTHGVCGHPYTWGVWSLLHMGGVCGHTLGGSEVCVTTLTHGVCGHPGGSVWSHMGGSEVCVTTLTHGVCGHPGGSVWSHMGGGE